MTSQFKVAKNPEELEELYNWWIKSGCKKSWMFDHSLCNLEIAYSTRLATDYPVYYEFSEDDTYLGRWKPACYGEIK